MPTSNKRSSKKTEENTKKSTFAERTAQRKKDENQWEQYNASAKFYSKNTQKSLEELAAKTFPSDELNRKAYQEAVANSLVETISPEIGIRDFWGKMEEAGCKELRIEDGHLSFYINKTEKIDITPFTQAIIFEAHSSYYEQRTIERKERIESAKKQLEELLAEINIGRKRK